MRTSALLPLYLLRVVSNICVVLCDDPSSGVTPIVNLSIASKKIMNYDQAGSRTSNMFSYSEIPVEASFSFTSFVVEFNDTDWASFFLNSISTKRNNTVFYVLNNDAKFYLYSQWLTKFVPSIYTVVFTVALPLNLMAIVMFLLKIKIETPAVVYMLNLALADMLFVTVLPFSIVYRFSGNNWQIGEGMCRFATAAFYCNMYCSILLMTSMSADRYMAVVFPMHSRTWRTKTRSWLVCVFIWLVSIASTVPLLLTNQTFYSDRLDITTCHDVLDLKEQQSFYMYYFTAFSSIFFFFPLIITIFCYAEVIRALSENPKSIKNSSKKKKRAILLSIIVLSVFIICFGPTNIIFLMHFQHFYSGLSDSLYFAYILCVCISSISTCLDPLMYYYASSKCRKYVYSLLCCKMSDKLQTSQSHAIKGSSTESSLLSK